MGISPFRNVYMGYCVICCVHTYICTGSVGTLVRMYAEICLYSHSMCFSEGIVGRPGLLPVVDGLHRLVCALLLVRFPGRNLVLAHTQSPVGRSLPAARCFGLICPWVRKVVAVYLGQGGRLVVKVQLMPVITVSISQLRYRRWNTGVLARTKGSGRTDLAKMQGGDTKKRRHADGHTSGGV